MTNQPTDWRASPPAERRPCRPLEIFCALVAAGTFVYLVLDLVARCRPGTFACEATTSFGAFLCSCNLPVLHLVGMACALFSAACFGLQTLRRR